MSSAVTGWRLCSDTPQVAPQHVAQEGEELHVERIVEPHLLTQGGDRLRRGPLAQHQPGGVAGDRARMSTKMTTSTPRAVGMARPIRLAR